LFSQVFSVSVIFYPFRGEGTQKSRYWRILNHLSSRLLLKEKIKDYELE